MVIKSVTLDILYRCDWNGSTMVLTNKFIDSESYHDVYYSLPIIDDVDNNGTWEYIMASGFWDLAVLNSSFARIWQVDTPRFDIMRRAQGVADVNGDGIKEIAVQYMADLPPNPPNADYKPGAPGVALANILACYSGTGAGIIWSMNMKNDVLGSGDVIVKDIQAADIDGDGLKEFILTTNTGYLYAINGETNPTSRVAWKLNIGTELGSPIVTDFDNDGKSEVLVFGGDGKVYAIN